MTSGTAGYRPSVGIMVLNRARRGLDRPAHDAPAEPEGPGSLVADAAGRHRRERGPGEGRAARAARGDRHPLGPHHRREPGWYTYDLPPDLRPNAWGGRYRGQKQKWFAVRFLGSDAEVLLQQPGHKPEFDAWRWARIDELLGLIVPFKRAVYEQVIRDFAALAKPAA